MPLKYTKNTLKERKKSIKNMAETGNDAFLLF
jgi:hypothetical protein